MANITHRGNTFRIRVFVGTDINGKKIMKSTTFTPPDDVTPKKAEKLAQEYAFNLSISAEVTCNLMTVCVFPNLQIGILPILLPLNLKKVRTIPTRGSIKITLHLFLTI